MQEIIIDRDFQWRTYDKIPISIEFSGVFDTPDVMRMSDEYGVGFGNYDYDNLGLPIVQLAFKETPHLRSTCPKCVGQEQK